MKINALRLFNVKQFENRGVAIEDMGDGVNVLAAPNEFGKSTTFEALNALFFVRYGSQSTDAKALRPYSGGAPRVEADITTPDGRYRVTKQFLNKPMAEVYDLNTGRILAQADEAEAFISNIVGDGTSGPASLLWVKQGVTGWERRTKTEDENEANARSDLLQSVQGEVEAITGGRRMAEIQGATEAELKELVTATGRPKTGGKYAEAINERERLEGELQHIDAEVEKLRTALDRRAANRRRLDDINSPQEQEARDTALSKATEAFEAARVRHEGLERLKTELALALANRSAAARDLEQFEQALTQASQLEGQLPALKQQLAEAVLARQAAQDADQNARLAVEGLDTELTDRRKALDRCDLALRAREAAARLLDLQATLDNALKTRAAIEALKAELSAKVVPASALKQLENLETDLLRLQAVRDAARPSVSVEYETASAPRLLMDETELKDFEPRTYQAQTLLTAPGIGTILLRSNSAEVTADLDTKEKEHRSLLATLGVESLAAARLRQDQAQRLQAQIDTEDARLDAYAPKGIEALQQEIALYKEAAQDLPEGDLNRQALVEAHEAAQQRLTQALEHQRLCAATSDAATKTFFDISTRHSTLEGQISQSSQRLPPADSRDAEQARLTQALAAAQALHDAAKTKVDEAQTLAADFEFAEAALARARSVKEAASAEVSKLQLENAALDGQIRTSADEAIEEKRNEIAEALEAVATRVASFVHEIAILQRLAAALESARLEAKELYLTPVLAELKPLLSLLFPDSDIGFDDQSLLPTQIVRKGLAEDVDKLSGGMREQLSILTRLAFARLLARTGKSVPIVLDDALVYSDDDRIEQMFTALHRQAKDQQLVVLSCRQRAFQQLGGTVLTLKPWVQSG